MIPGFILGGLLVTYWVVFVGAPYVPTRQRDIEKVLGMLDLGSADRVVDLGSGDGRLQLGLAKRGFKSSGYELSLPLYLISIWRLRKYRKYANVQLVNFWKQQLPDDTTVVFTFLADKYMAKLAGLLQKEANRLNRSLTLVSYGFELPGYRPANQDRAVLVYKVEPQA